MTEPLPIAERRKPRVLLWLALALALMFTCGGFAACSAWRLLSDVTASRSAMRDLVEEQYPGYTWVDSTRSGPILRSDAHEGLLIDVRYMQQETAAPWGGAPVECASGDLWTIETFFRHAEGMEPDPRTDLNYDVDGFYEAFDSVRPGPDAVVSSVWLASTDAFGGQHYTVLVARRNRTGSTVEPMWPDHYAEFVYDPARGAWEPSEFVPVEIDNRY